jgi:C1A family cysteine protease
MTDYRKYKLDYVASPDDPKDYTVAMVLGRRPLIPQFPKEFSIPFLSFGKIKDQGEVGSCVAHSLSYCREMQEYKQSGLFKEFSVGFIYANRDDRYTGEGMVARYALDSLRKDGDVLLPDFPYNKTYPEVKALLDANKASLISKAAPYKVTTYCRLYSAADIKTALVNLGPVSIGVQIYDSFYDNVGTNGIVPIPNTYKEKCYGGHEMTIIGWKVVTGKEYWIVLNSWGSTWADKGLCYLPMGFPIQEAWSITDLILPEKQAK